MHLCLLQAEEVGIQLIEYFLEVLAYYGSQAVYVPTDEFHGTGITGKLILTWVNHADLFRIKGIGPQFSELLEASGVDTVKELKHRVAANLVAKMTEVNEAKHLTKVVPTEVMVQKMIDQAKELPPMVEY